MGQLLGCSMEGVAAESVREILTGKVTQLKQDHQRTLQQVKYSERLFSLECRAIRDGEYGSLMVAHLFSPAEQL